MKTKLILTFLILLTILPIFALAQEYTISNWLRDKGFWKILFGPDIPDEFLASNYSILQYLVFPFIAIWTIIYGIINELPIFKSDTVKYILSFIIAAIAGPTGYLVLTVNTLFVLYGQLAVWGFMTVLFGGTIVWILSKHYEFGILGTRGGATDRLHAAAKGMYERKKLVTKLTELREALEMMDKDDPEYEDFYTEYKRLLKEYNNIKKEKEKGKQKKFPWEI